MKKDSLAIDGKIYLSSKRAAEIAGYSKDYVGQLCRSGKLVCRTVGRLWYVDEASLRKHQAESFKANQTSFRPAGFVPSAPQKPVELNISKPLIPAAISDGFSVHNPINTPSPVSSKPVSNNYSRLMLTIAIAVIIVMAGGMTTLLAGGSLLPKDFSRSIDGNLASVYSVTNAVSGILGSAFDLVYSDIASDVFRFSPSNPSAQLALSNSANDEVDESDNPMVAHAGLVVVPQTVSSTNATDAKLAQTITNSFSDNVTVTPGPNGTTGVITPEFRTIKGHDFLYVLVPVKTSSSSPTSTVAQND